MTGPYIIPPRNKPEINLKASKVPFGYDLTMTYRALEPAEEEAVFLNLLHALAKTIDLKKSIKYLTIAEHAGEDPIGWKDTDWEKM